MCSIPRYYAKDDIINKVHCPQQVYRNRAMFRVRFMQVFKRCRLNIFIATVLKVLGNLLQRRGPLWYVLTFCVLAYVLSKLSVVMYVFACLRSVELDYLCIYASTCYCSDMDCMHLKNFKLESIWGLFKTLIQFICALLPYPLNIITALFCDVMLLTWVKCT